MPKGVALAITAVLSGTLLAVAAWFLTLNHGRAERDDLKPEL